MTGRYLWSRLRGAGGKRRLARTRTAVVAGRFEHRARRVSAWLVYAMADSAGNVQGRGKRRIAGEKRASNLAIKQTAEGWSRRFLPPGGRRGGGREALAGGS